MVTAPLVVTNVCSCSQHHLMCPFQSHEQAWGLERLSPWPARATEGCRHPRHLAASSQERPGISQQYWGSFGRSLWRDKKESLLHLAGGGGTGPSHRKAVSARQGTDLGTGGLGGSRQVDCSIIGLARCPHTSIKCFQQPCEGRLDPPIFQMRKRRLGAMQGTCRDPSVGTWQRTFSATPCPLLILFQAHSLCLEVLCSGAQLHLY